MSAQRGLFRGQALLVPDALRGYRTWAGVTVDRRLRSTGVTHAWSPACFVGEASAGEESARCLAVPQDQHPAPERTCSCGIYGWYHPDDTRIVSAPIFGAVRLSGRVVLGTHGFRAERASVLALTVADPLVRHELRLLGYPVYDSRAELLEAFPPEDVSALTGHRCGPGDCLPLALGHAAPSQAGPLAGVLGGLALVAVAAHHALRWGLGRLRDGAEQAVGR